MPQTERLREIAHRARALELTRTVGRIDLDNLSEEVAGVGAEVIWWGMLAAEAAADVDTAKLRVETVRAQSARAYRDRMALNSATTRVTEAMVTEELALTPAVYDAEQALTQATENAGVLRAVHFALGGKQRTLESLAGLVGQTLRARDGGPLGNDWKREAMQAEVAARRRAEGDEPPRPRRQAVP
jgi:hypothetical protein